MSLGRVLVVALLSSVVAAPAYSSFPNLQCAPKLEGCQVPGTESYLQSVRWVDDRGAVCDNASLGVEYADDDDDLDFDEPLRVEGLVGGQRVQCFPAILRKTTLRAVLTLVIDENAADEDVECDAVFEGAASLALTAILEIGAGKRRAVFAESLTGCEAIEFAPWSSFDESIVFRANPFNSLLSTLSFEARVRSFVNDAGLLPPGLENAPMVVGGTFGDVERLNSRPLPASTCDFGCGVGETDARGNDGASVARYSVTIKFACPANAPPSSCR